MGTQGRIAFYMAQGKHEVKGSSVGNLFNKRLSCLSLRLAVNHLAQA